MFGEGIRRLFHGFAVFIECLPFAFDVGFVVADLGLHESQRLGGASLRLGGERVAVQRRGHRPVVGLPELRRRPAEGCDLFAVGPNKQPGNRRTVVDLLLHLTIPDPDDEHLVVGATDQDGLTARQSSQRGEVAARVPSARHPTRVDRGPDLDHAAGVRGGELPVVNPSDGPGVRRRGLAGDPFAGRGFPEAHSAVGEQYGDQFPVGRHGQLFGGLAKRPGAP